MENYKAKYGQVRRVYNGEHLDDIRKRLERRYRNKRIKRQIRDGAMFAAYYAGTLAAASLLAFAYIGAIAILCGF